MDPSVRARPAFSLGMTNLSSRRQFKESTKLVGRLDAHDELLQFFALILADNIATECGELHRNFILGHAIARIALGNINPRGIRCSIVSRQRAASRLNLA